MDVLRRQRSLCTLSSHLCSIPIDIIDEATRTLWTDKVNKVATLTIEEGDRSVDTIPETEVKAPVELIHLFVGQVVVRWFVDIDPWLDQACIAEEGQKRTESCKRVVHVGYGTRHTIGDARRERGKRLEVREERFT